jgi:hypothetical protein
MFSSLLGFIVVHKQINLIKARAALEARLFLNSIKPDDPASRVHGTRRKLRTSLTRRNLVQRVQCSLYCPQCGGNK